MGLKTYDSSQSKAVRSVKADSKSIQKLQKNLNKQVSDIKQMLVETVKAQAHYQKPLKELLDTQAHDPKVLKSELDEIRYAVIPNNVPSSQAGISYSEKQGLMQRVYQAENELIRQKTGFEPSGENLRLIGEATGTWDPNTLKWKPNFNDRIMRELILLDDIPSWLISGIKSVASTVLPTLAKKGLDYFTGTVTSKIDQLTQDKEVVSSTRQNKVNTTTQVVNSDDLIYEPTRVDVASLAGVLCPSIYKVVGRFDDVMPAAIYTGFFEIPVIPTTANGTFFFSINGFSFFNTGNFDFITYTNAANTYNPVTGAYTGTLTNIDAPVFTGSTSVSAARIMGIEVSYKPTAVSNTQYAVGQVDMYHDPSMTLPLSAVSVSPSQYLSLTNIGYRPFYQRGPVISSFDQVWYNPLDLQDFTNSQSSGTYNSPIIVIVSSANTSGVQVGTLVVHITYNVIPTSVGMSALPIQSPGVGPYTADIMDSVFTLAPQVFMANQKERLEIVKDLMVTQPLYRDQLKCITGKKLGNKTATPYSSSSSE